MRGKKGKKEGGGGKFSDCVRVSRVDLSPADDRKKNGKEEGGVAKEKGKKEEKEGGKGRGEHLGAVYLHHLLPIDRRGRKGEEGLREG